MIVPTRKTVSSFMKIDGPTTIFLYPFSARSFRGNSLIANGRHARWECKPVTVEFSLDAFKGKSRRASVLLKAMSNEHRLMALCFLRDGEKSVGELEKLLGLSQSALSQHLARLRRDDLVKTRRRAQTIFYSLKGKEASTIIATLYALCCRAKIVDVDVSPIVGMAEAPRARPQNDRPFTK